MEIALLSALTATNATAILLTPETLAATQAATAGLLEGRLTLTEGMAKADEVTTYLTPERTVWVLGLGSLTELQAEKLRAAVSKAVSKAAEHKHATLQLVWMGAAGQPLSEAWLRAIGETPGLAAYQFLKYKSEAEKQRHTLTRTGVVTDTPRAAEALAYGANVARATNHARDLVNEPPNFLTQAQLAAEAKNLGERYGFQVTVHGKDWIEQQNMQGLLAVNRGSLAPPTYTVLEHKPANATNAKPLVLVGKGIVFDTGGLNLKPGASMDTMKCDMGGAAAVIGAFVALATNQVPVHTIGLIPSTDNRPGQDAYTPNDVITYSDGTTVEVRNTDAEGRLILADALLHARTLQPAVVIDLATLTGSAVMAIGSVGMPMYATGPETYADQLAAAGEAVYERCVRLPLWDEYREQLKSDIADLKNIGGREAGSITAAKFLQHFTDYPWLHLDIAGPAFLDSGKHYRPKNGTGWGVRILAEFARTFVPA